MKKNILKLIIILIGIILIYFAKTSFTEYNLEKSISACVVAQKRTSEHVKFEINLPKEKVVIPFNQQLISWTLENLIKNLYFFQHREMFGSTLENVHKTNPPKCAFGR